MVASRGTAESTEVDSRRANDGPKMEGPALAPEALALLEFDSIAVGTRAADALIKKAPVAIERLGSLQPGIFAILWSGDVASVRESFDEALRVGGRAVRDRMFLAHVEPTVYFAVLGRQGEFDGDTLGIIETNRLGAAIEAADAAVKGASVRVVRIRLGDELGGKGLAHFVGEQHDVEAAIELAVARVERDDRTFEVSITPRIDVELAERLARSTRFWEVR